MKALILSADGFEDSELLTPYYRLREERVEVDVASAESGKIKGEHGYEVGVDRTLDEVKPNQYDALIIPGGKAPSALRPNQAALELAASFVRSNRLVATICHGPQILISAGLLGNRRVACHASLAKELASAGAIYENSEVVVDGNLITSRRPGDLPAFMRELIRALRCR